METDSLEELLRDSLRERQSDAPTAADLLGGAHRIRRHHQRILAACGTVVFVAAIAVGAVEIAGSTGASQPGQPAGSLSMTSSPSIPPSPTQTAIDSGGIYDHDERFCAAEPLKGSIGYAVTDGSASLRLDISGLPPSTLIGVEWSNNTVRGYTVGSFKSNRSGQAVQSTLKVFRGAETKGIKITLVSTTGSVIGRLPACNRT